MSERSFEQVAVLGFGTMGAGIAQVSAQAGCRVTVLETDQGALDRGFERVESFLRGGVERGKVTEAEAAEAVGRIHGVTDPAALADVELVVEAVYEDLAAKSAVLERVAAVVRADAVVATNTSALSVTALATSVTGPDRFAGLHFFNPVPLMRLVEIVAAEQTVPETLTALEAFVEQIGKRSIVTKDRPGFLVNRLLMPYLNQAIQAYDDGVATADDIDAAVELGLGYPMGPLRLLDLIGLDVHRHATHAAYEQLLDPHFAPPPLLGRLTAGGFNGRKTGRGFYEYGGDAT